MHTLKNDQPVAWCLDAVAEHAEHVTDVVLLYLRLDQTLGAFLQGLLHLADADDERAFVYNAGLHREAGEEMRFARAAAAPCALVTERFQQRLKYRRGADGQDAFAECRVGVSASSSSHCLRCPRGRAPATASDR